MNYRDCCGCEYFFVNDEGMKCRFEGSCVFQKSLSVRYSTDTKPFGYQTPEDNMEREVRHGR